MMNYRPAPRCICGAALVGGCIALTVGVAFVEAALAQDTDLVSIDATRCLEIEAPDERLACFEGEVGAARNNPRNVPTPPSATSPRTVDISEQPRPSPDVQGEFVGSIAALSFRAPNKYLVTLDNGQIWEQRVAERYLLRVGQRVRVYPSRWGEGYRLEADNLKGFIQVTRVR